LGYVGEEIHLLTPIKNPQTEEYIIYKTANCRTRSPIGRINYRIKIFKVVREWSRKYFELHELCVQVVCQIVNIAMEDNPLQYKFILFFITRLR
jgi:hypothetical protein